MLNILIPTDFSKEALQAIGMIRKLVDDRPCNFLLLHVIPVSSSITDMLFLPNYNSAQKKIFQDEVEVLKKKGHHQDSIKVHYQYGLSGPVLDQIISIHTIDFAVLPGRAKNKITQSMGELINTIRKSKIPVLSFPKDNKIKGNPAIGVVLEDAGYILSDLGVLSGLFAKKIVRVFKNSEEGIKVDDTIIARNKISSFIKESKINLLIQVKKQSFWSRIFGKKTFRFPSEVTSDIPLLSVEY